MTWHDMTREHRSSKRGDDQNDDGLLPKPPVPWPSPVGDWAHHTKEEPRKTTGALVFGFGFVLLGAFFVFGPSYCAFPFAFAAQPQARAPPARGDQGPRS